MGSEAGRTARGDLICSDGRAALIAGANFGVSAFEDKAGLRVAMAAKSGEHGRRAEPELVVPARADRLVATRLDLSQQLVDFLAEAVVFPSKRWARGLVRLVEQPSGLVEFRGPVAEPLFDAAKGGEKCRAIQR